MDSVLLEGKEYQRSALVAKKYGYTSDYIGQLSRSGKLDAKLVGRSWYVYSPSVEAYQSGRKSPDSCTSQEDSQYTDETRSVPIHRADVHRSKSTHKQPTRLSFIGKTSKLEPPVPQAIHGKRTSKESNVETGRSGDLSRSIKSSRVNLHKDVNSRSTHRSVEHVAKNSNVRTKLKTENSVSRVTPQFLRYATSDDPIYVPDDAHLIPLVKKEGRAGRKESLNHNVPVSLASATSLQVHNRSDNYSIVTSDLPKIRLKGKVPIAGSDDDFDNVIGEERSDQLVHSKIVDLAKRDMTIKNDISDTRDRNSASEKLASSHSRNPHRIVQNVSLVKRRSALDNESLRKPKSGSGDVKNAGESASVGGGGFAVRVTESARLTPLLIALLLCVSIGFSMFLLLGSSSLSYGTSTEQLESRFIFSSPW